MIIDTHCHLDDSRYFDDLQSVITKAREHGVKGFIIPGADITNLKIAKQICDAYEDIFFAAGVHPYDLDGYDEEILSQYLQDEKCVAVGECGLDYFRLPKENKEEEKRRQKEAFIAQINLAIKFQKPLIVHIREANQDSLDILKAHAKGKLKGVLHCFNASEMLLELSEDFYFGIGGVLTFKNAKNLVEILPKIPKDRLLLETDSPYLTPHPHRGTRNEPFYTTLVAEKMSEILGLTQQEVRQITTKNAKELFSCFKI